MTKLNGLGAEARMQLMQFICSFAWADLNVHPREREFIAKMVGKLGLDEGERAQVEEWLKVPPSPESVDPTAIPAEHRRLFVESIEGIIHADGHLAEEEEENYVLLRDLLG